jgi:hypothetical protein
MIANRVRYDFKQVADLNRAVVEFQARFPGATVDVKGSGVVTSDARFAAFAERYRADAFALAGDATKANALEGASAHRARIVAAPNLFGDALIEPAAATKTAPSMLRPSFEPPPFFPAEVRAFFESPEYRASLDPESHPLMTGSGLLEDGRVTIHGTNTELPDPGHLMGTDVSRGTHSSFAPRNHELPRAQRTPGRGVGVLQAFPQAEMDLSIFTTAGKHFDLGADPYVFEQAKEVDPSTGTLPVATDRPKAQHFAWSFDARFIDPAAFSDEVSRARTSAGSSARAAAYQAATVSDNPLENPRVRPLPEPLSPTQAERLEEQRRAIDERGSNQAQNCVTSLLWQLFNTPMPAPSKRTVLTTEDLSRLGMEPSPDGGPPRFVPGRDLRPQDLFLYLRWQEKQHLGSLARRGSA